MLRSIWVLLAITTLAGCREWSNGPTLFEKIESDQSGVRFVNTVTNNKDFNIFKYRNFYNGGGAAIGDINNDGLADLFFLFSTLGHPKSKFEQLSEIVLLFSGIYCFRYRFFSIQCDLNREYCFSDFNSFFRA